MNEESAPRERKWYIVHTYSGFEDRVKETLRQRAEALGMGDAFGDVRIPTETVVEYKGGKKKETQRKFFPGYILVEMEMSDAAWHVVKNTPKVSFFLPPLYSTTVSVGMRTSPNASPIPRASARWRRVSLTRSSKPEEVWTMYHLRSRGALSSLMKAP